MGVDAPAELEITQHGTYLSRPRDAGHARVFARLARLLPDALARERDPDTREALREVAAAVAASQVSGRVREAGRFELSPQELGWLLRHPESSWLPYLVYRYRFKHYPPRQKLLPFPPYVLIEPTSVCNLRCVMCFQVDPTFTTREYMGSMDWDLFTRVADELAAHGCAAVTLASRGEPTLHRRFGDMLAYLRDAGVMDVKTNTNATRLDEKLCHEILSAEVSEVVFSVDAGTAESYEAIRVRGRFERVVANVERFHEIRARHYPDSPTVTRVSGVKVRDDQDLAQMNAFWSARVDEVTIKEALPRWDTYGNAPCAERRPCSLLWESVYVWWDGTVNPCDSDYKSELSVGNAHEATLAEIWHGARFRELREAHVAGQRGGVRPCDRCPLT